MTERYGLSAANTPSEQEDDASRLEAIRAAGLEVEKALGLIPQQLETAAEGVYDAATPVAEAASSGQEPVGAESDPELADAQAREQAALAAATAAYDESQAA